MITLNWEFLEVALGHSDLYLNPTSQARYVRLEWVQVPFWRKCCEGTPKGHREHRALLPGQIRMIQLTARRPGTTTTDQNGRTKKTCRRSQKESGQGGPGKPLGRRQAPGQEED